MSSRGRSSTARPARTSRPRGPSRSACRRTGGTRATRFRQAAPSGRRRPTSSATRSVGARPLCGGRSTTRFPFCWPSGRSWCSFWFGLSRATWRPTAPLRLARRRSWGQVLTAAARMYAGHLTLFLGIGLVLLPISLLVTLLQAIVIHASSIAGISTDGESGGVLVFLVFVIGTALTLLGLSLVIAASARAMAEIDRGRRIGPFGAYRLAFDRARPLFGAVVIMVAAVSLLVSSVLLVPIGIWLAVRWSLAIFAAEFEGCSALRGAAAKPPSRPRALAESRIAHGVRSGARTRPRPARRRPADPPDERPALHAQPRRGSGQCRDDAVRRADNRVRLLRRPRAASSSSRPRSPISCRRSSSSRAEVARAASVRAGARFGGSSLSGD